MIVDIPADVDVQLARDLVKERHDITMLSSEFGA